MGRKLQDIIEELEEKHRVVEQNMIAAIWVFDAETMKFEYVTSSIEEISGYSVDEYMKLTLKDILTPDSLEKVKTTLVEEMEKYEQGIVTTRRMGLDLLNKCGDIYSAEISARLFREAGKSLKVVGLTREIDDQIKVNQQQNELINKLTEALAEKEKLLKEVKVLRGLLPICSGCKRIRDEEGKWWPLDAYVRARTEAELTHTICGDCKDVLYSDLK